MDMLGLFSGIWGLPKICGLQLTKLLKTALGHNKNCSNVLLFSDGGPVLMFVFKNNGCLYIYIYIKLPNKVDK